MRKLVLLIFALWQLNGAFGQTSVYHPFPSDSAVWNVSFTDYWNYICKNYSNSITGDTVINGVTYHKIWEQGENFLMKNANYPDPQYCTNQRTGTFNFYRGAIREDIVQRKIYFFDAFDSTESLLYDFKLAAGDTIKGYFNRYNSYHIVIKSVDSTLIGTQYHKTWNIEPMCGWGGMPPQIIEGIGSIFGLLELPCGIEKQLRYLTCFSENNKTLYPSYLYNTMAGCALITSINEKEGLENTLSIFPNPSNGKFQLALSNTRTGAIEISDVLGNRILKSEIKNETTEIDLSNYPLGIYFVKISDPKGNFVVKKIVKQ